MVKFWKKLVIPSAKNNNKLVYIKKYLKINTKQGFQCFIQQ